MTLDEYYDYMEAEGKKALEQLETELKILIGATKYSICLMMRSKKMVRGTSIDCYYSNIKNKSENKQFRLIIDCLLEKGSATRGEIAHHLKMEKSTVAARVNAMLKYGILQEVGKRKDKISGVNNYVVAINKDGQGRLF
ncbi:winged helix-turn-helix domain-containing protein [Brachyspira hyodysenteriae]|nr:winged helix-turn-helix domain-containing protein [Brachyspira hyodysenteriae]MDA0073480.1 winged helix-turn-helix domain-containing protein [Brachyspira hyodysenteriae]